MTEPARTANSKEDKFGIESTTRKFVEFSYAESSILRGIFSGKLENDRIANLKSILGSICQTATSIGILSERSFSNEATMLTRSFLEKVINFMYVIVADEYEYQQYISYSRQKAFRRLNRKITVGSNEIGFKLNGIDTSKLPQELKDDLYRFTGSKGGEKTRWTNKSLEERLDIIEKRSSIKAPLLMLMMLDVYENASEALHGTFYGCTFHTGYYLPESDRDEKESCQSREQKNLTLINLNIGTAIHQLIKFISDHEGKDVKEICKYSEANLDAASDLMKKIIDP